MKKNLFIFIIVLLRLILPGQGGFKRQYKLPFALNNTTKNIFETSPGQYVVCGICVDTLNNYQTNRLVLTGLNTQGQPQWTKKYGNIKFQYLDNSFITKWFYKQGNFIYHAGCVRDSNNIQLGVLIKFNFNGDTIWQKRFYDSTGVDVIPQMVTGSIDGGFLMTGFFQGNGYSKVLIIKTDINGNELWRKKIAKAVPNVQDAKVILQDSVTKKIITVGYQYIGSSTAYKGYSNVLILDSLGNKLSQHNYTGAEGILLDLIQTKDKKLVAVGQQKQSLVIGALETYKSFAVKFDLNNPTIPLWKLFYDKTAVTNEFTRAIESSNGNLFLAGYLDTMMQNNLPTNCLQRITKIDANGNVISNKYYDYSPNSSVDNNQLFLGFNQTSDNGFIAAFQVINLGVNPFFVVKYDSLGCDSSLSYCQTVNLKELAINYDLIKIYPNPTSELLNFDLENLPSKENLNIEIANILGQKVLESEFEKTINISCLQKGIYFLKLFDNGKLIGRKKIIKE